MVILIKDKKGQALVEMAFVLPLLLLILMGIVEFGRIFNAHLIITNASREGARYAAVHSTDAEIEAVIDNLTSTLDQNNLTLTITPSFANRTSGSTVEVRIDYDIDIIAPLISAVIPDPFRITAYTVMRVE